jgi:hypothetical protein
MIPRGHHIDAGRKDFLGGFRSYPGPAGGVFAVGNDGIQAMLQPQQRHQGADGPPPGFPNNVANEQYFHGAQIKAALSMSKLGNGLLEAQSARGKAQGAKRKGKAQGAKLKAQVQSAKRQTQSSSSKWKLWLEMTR